MTARKLTCARCRRKLTKAQDPEQPPAPLAMHLARCQPCRDWQQHLLRLEANVRRIPIPPSHPRPLPESPRPTLPTVLPPDEVPLPLAPRWSVQQRVTLALSGLAATLLIVGCGILLGSLLSNAVGPAPEIAKNPEKRSKPPALAPLAATVLAGDVNLATAESPRQRVQELARIAQALQEEAGTLARAGAAPELEKLAALYVRIIREGVLPQARVLPRTERLETLAAIAGELTHTRQQAEDLAARTPTTAPALRLVAAAARDGDNQLRALMAEVSK